MHKQKVMVVNSAAETTSTRVNVRVAVNTSAIRREQYNGREHIVVPSFTLPDEVIMNGGLYPRDEIEKSYKSLEGTFAPLGHPQVDGEYVGAERPEAVNAYHFGAFNKNVERKGNRIYVEKFIDVEKAKESEMGRRVLNAIDKGDPIHTSTGIFLDREMTPNADGYGWIARNMHFNHDCLLLDEQGAATPEDGVGMMVNKTLVINSLITNDDEALDNSYGEKREILGAAVKERFGSMDSYAYVEDFDGRALVYCTPEGLFKIEYHFEGDNPILTGEPQPVVAKTDYMVKNEETLFSRILERFKSVVQYSSTKPKPPVQANVIEEVDMTPEELQALLDAQAEKISGAFNAKLEAQSEIIASLKTEMQANSEAGLKDKRAEVAKVHGEVVANALSGEALDAMFASVQTAAGILSGAPATNADEFKAPTMDAHFGGAQ